jgi:hypothetical protein
MSIDSGTPTACLYAQSDADWVEHKCRLSPQSLRDDFEETRYAVVTGLHNCAVECGLSICGYQFHPEDAERLREACESALATIQPLLRSLRVVPVLRRVR